MRFTILFSLVSFLVAFQPGAFGQESTPTHYRVEFPNAAHHEAEITATFRNSTGKPLQIRMARSSPGRYALHEFAKNMYNISITDEKGNKLPFTHPNPHEWQVNSSGTVLFSYSLFGDRADGTYNQIDLTHAHLNIPATFVYAVGFDKEPVSVDFTLTNKDWTAATQLQPSQPLSNLSVRPNRELKLLSFYAPNLQYFMDSPIELAPFSKRSFTVSEKGKEKTIEIALHHTGTEQQADSFASATKRVVLEQQAIFGELPDFDFNRYTIIACYMPHASGDGMEHRNSTVCTSPAPLKDYFTDNLSTVSHEFFHSWNVERIRPKSLEPFPFEEANMSGELWLAEGFTSYYGELAMRRAGIYSDAVFLTSIEADINAYLLSPGAHQSGPVHMSQQAPFVDAARSVDPTNRQNTYLSYYTYGSVLALYLDLSLRARPEPLSLDGFMQLLWQRFGKAEKPYNLSEIEQALADFTSDKAFAADFFQKHIYGAEFLDFAPLLANAGISLKPITDKPTLGPERFTETNDGLRLETATYSGSPLYSAGLERDDVVLKINGKKATKQALEKHLAKTKAEETLELEVWQKGRIVKVTVKPQAPKAIKLRARSDDLVKEGANTKNFRRNWLDSKTK